MRALQFAGAAIERNPSRTYNCAYLPIDSIYSFSESMFLLLGGTGVGYSVQFRHVEKLPAIQKPTRQRRYLIGDSIEGWADAVKVLMKAYMAGGALPIFDYSDIRHKGARLITAGGKAPGPEPLKIALTHIQAILDRKEDDEKLKPIECHDIQCHIANAVLAGGIRRAAMICLFSPEDDEMLTCKYGNWWELNEQRGRANNSAVLLRGSVNEKQFKDLWKKIELSGSGEPGIYWTNNLDWGTNPCCEIALRPYQFCNLCEVNVSDVESQDDLNNRVDVAAFFGTLQAGFTDFHYLRSVWKRTTEKDALLGIGMTGIASGEILKYDLTEAMRVAIHTNKVVAKMIEINSAARIGCVKPSGTTSCVLGTSSGIHAWHDNYYLRTVRFNKNESIAQYIMENAPELYEDDLLRPHDTICVRIPIKAPAGSILRTETAIDLLERVKHFSNTWIKPGHIDGDNTHNVSATISIDKQRTYEVERPAHTNGGFATEVHDTIDEWEKVGNWMWTNQEVYNGLSVLPFDNGTYSQAPFETITEDQYNERISILKAIDLTQVLEEDDNVAFGQTEACAGGKCEI